MSKKQHADLLKPAAEDQVALACAIAERWPELQGSWFRVKGVELAVPPDVAADHGRWKTVLRRFQLDDFRISASEWSSMKAFAQWTVNMNCVLRNQPPKLVPELQ